MQIELKEISIRELTDHYQDNAENGVTAYHDKLDVESQLGKYPNNI